MRSDHPGAAWRRYLAEFSGPGLVFGLVYASRHRLSSSSDFRSNGMSGIVIPCVLVGPIPSQTAASDLFVKTPRASMTGQVRSRLKVRIVEVSEHL